MSTRNIAFWLVPSPEDAKVLQVVTDDLAKRFRSSLFKPHLTLFSGQFGQKEKPWKNLPHLEPLTLSVREIEATDSYTKTLFVRFHQDKALCDLREKLNNHVSKTNSNSWDPHLSLLYANLPLNEKQTLAENFILPLEKIHFTSISAIEHPETVTKKKDVEAFRKLSS